MRRMAWMLVMGVAAVVGHSHRAWGAGSDWQPVVVVVGGIVIVTLCLVGGLVWAFVAWVFRCPPRDTGTKTEIAGIKDRNRNSTKEPDDISAPRPR